MSDEPTFLSPDLFAGTYEPESVAGGEYQLRILNLEINKQKKEPFGQFLQATLDIPSEPKSKNIYHVMMFPTAQDDEKKTNNRKRAIQFFFQAFGIDVSRGVNLAEAVGNMGWALLEEEDDPEYGTRNRVKKFILPK